MSDCIFCKIVKKEIPAEVVYEDATVMAFEDIVPQAPVHIVVIPKKHIETIQELQQEDISVLENIFSSIQHIAKAKNIDKSGFRIVNNCLSDGGQLVPHLHFHLLGGRKLTWPPG